jgi:hypothetical protein
MSGNLSTKHTSGPSRYERGQETEDRNQESGAPDGQARKILEETRARWGSRGKIVLRGGSIGSEAGLTLVQGARALWPEHNPRAIRSSILQLLAPSFRS